MKPSVVDYVYNSSTWKAGGRLSVMSLSPAWIPWKVSDHLIHRELLSNRNKKNQLNNRTEDYEDEVA